MEKKQKMMRWKIDMSALCVTGKYGVTIKLG